MGNRTPTPAHPRAPPPLPTLLRPYVVHWKRIRRVRRVRRGPTCSPTLAFSNALAEGATPMSDQPPATPQAHVAALAAIPDQIAALLRRAGPSVPPVATGEWSAAEIVGHLCD